METGLWFPLASVGWGGDELIACRMVRPTPHLPTLLRQIPCAIMGMYFFQFYKGVRIVPAYMQDIQKVLLDESQISKRVKELGQTISENYANRNLVLVSILKGAFTFTADLARTLTIPVALDFMALSSYGTGTHSSGEVRILKDLDYPVEGRDVLIVEDIIDTGVTLAYLMDYFRARQVASVKVCALLNKSERRQVGLTADYVGFEIGDEFVVGYGLDYAEQYRHLPFIGVLRPEVYEG